MKYESVEVPFVQIGNRRWLTGRQLAENPDLAAFVARFSSSFEYEINMDCVLFVEPADVLDRIAEHQHEVSRSQVRT